MGREFSPIIGQFPDRERIKCKDCKYALHTMFSGIDIGPQKAYCKIYCKENSNGKPIGILFKDEDCVYYEQELENKTEGE